MDNPNLQCLGGWGDYNPLCMIVWEAVPKRLGLEVGHTSWSWAKTTETSISGVQVKHSNKNLPMLDCAHWLKCCACMVALTSIALYAYKIALSCLSCLCCVQMLLFLVCRARAIRVAHDNLLGLLHGQILAVRGLLLICLVSWVCGFEPCRRQCVASALFSIAAPDLCKKCRTVWLW